jgi:hypothetical protein
VIDQTFDCPVAKKTVTFSVNVRHVRNGFPPVREYGGCTGVSLCGVEQHHNGGASYNWDICPQYRAMLGLA